MNHAVVLVLGDLGRSPRMQYHAYSLAEMHSSSVGSHSSKQWKVSVIGYEGENVINVLSEHPYVSIHRLTVWDLPFLKIISLVHALSKGILLFINVFCQLLRLPTYQFIIIQNPPCLPALAAAILVSWSNGSKIMIDWHNLGFAMFQDRLGPTHLLVLFAKLLECVLVSFASYHICVSQAMKHWLLENFRVCATVLYDRPPSLFKDRAMSSKDRHQLLLRLGYTTEALFGFDSHMPVADLVERTIQTVATCGHGDKRTHYSMRSRGSDCVHSSAGGRVGLVMSCTSWTPDEDFNLLLRALLIVEEHLQNHSDGRAIRGYDRLVVVITGKGPMKAAFETAVKEYAAQGRLNLRVAVRTAWLSHEDYPALLRCADLGISLHTSTSGLDLPMKVLDMFGSAVPVCAFSFPTLPELVQDGVNGIVFTDSSQLAAQIVRLLIDPNVIDGNAEPQRELLMLGQGAACITSWEENWATNMKPILIDAFPCSFL